MKTITYNRALKCKKCGSVYPATFNRFTQEFEYIPCPQCGNNDRLLDNKKWKLEKA